MTIDKLHSLLIALWEILDEGGLNPIAVTVSTPSGDYMIVRGENHAG